MVILLLFCKTIPSRHFRQQGNGKTSKHNLCYYEVLLNHGHHCSSKSLASKLGEKVPFQQQKQLLKTIKKWTSLRNLSLSEKSSQPPELDTAEVPHREGTMAVLKNSNTMKKDVDSATLIEKCKAI